MAPTTRAQSAQQAKMKNTPGQSTSTPTAPVPHTTSSAKDEMAPKGKNALRASTPTRLITLPPEIFERIAEECDDPFLKALRLISRESKSRASTIHKIVRHPTFGKAVRSLTVCPETTASHKTKGPRRLGNKAHFLRISKKDVSMLYDFFEQLAAMGRSVKVTIADIDAAIREPSAYSHLLEQGGETEFYHHRADAVTMTTEAIIQSRVSLQAFCIRGEYAVGARYLVGKPQRTLLESICEKVKSLELAIHCEPDAVLAAGEELGKVIALASKLEHLSLDVQEDSPGSKSLYHAYQVWQSLDNSSTVAEVLDGAFPALKSLKIEGAIISCGKLVGFVERHKVLSLASLSLVNCSMTGYTSSQSQQHPASCFEDELRQLTGLQEVKVRTGNRTLLIS